jgi:hypothetical protein
MSGVFLPHKYPKGMASYCYIGPSAGWMNAK